MAVPAPQRHDKAVLLLPFEFLTIDYRHATATKRVINNAVVMPVRLGNFARTKHLNVAGHRRHGLAALGIDEFQRDAVEWATGPVAKLV